MTTTGQMVVYSQPNAPFEVWKTLWADNLSPRDSRKPAAVCYVPALWLEFPL